MKTMEELIQLLKTRNNNLHYFKMRKFQAEQEIKGYNKNINEAELDIDRLEREIRLYKNK